MPTSAEPSVQLVGNLATWPRPSDRSSNSKREKERLVYAVIQKQSSGRWRQIIQVKQIIICIFIFILNKSSSRNHLFLSLICFPLFFFFFTCHSTEQNHGNLFKNQKQSCLGVFLFLWFCFWLADDALILLFFFFFFITFSRSWHFPNAHSALVFFLALIPMDKRKKVFYFALVKRWWMITWPYRPIGPSMYNESVHYQLSSL